MREKTNLGKLERGIVGFLPLVIIAVLLIGFVGYVSVNRLKAGNDKVEAPNTSSQSTVLALNTSSDTNMSEDSQDLQGNELDDMTKELESVDSLDTGIPEVDNSIKANDAAMKNGSLDNVNSAEMMQGSGSATPKVARIKGVRRLKLFGVIPVNADVTLDVNTETGEEVSLVDQPFYLKYLGFLFSK